jgi:hypothetical protein
MNVIHRLAVRFEIRIIRWSYRRVQSRMLRLGLGRAARRRIYRALTKGQEVSALEVISGAS